MIRFRDATRGDVAAVIALLTDDALGATREHDDQTQYLAAFDAMQAEGNNHLIVGDEGGKVIATYQITFIQRLSLRAARRAQIESVRVSSKRRGRGIGKALMADAEKRARAAGCALMQLTTHATRNRARNFYDSIGFTASHVGYKHPLD